MTRLAPVRLALGLLVGALAAAVWLVDGGDARPPGSTERPGSPAAPAQLPPEGGPRAAPPRATPVASAAGRSAARTAAPRPAAQEPRREAPLEAEIPAFAVPGVVLDERGLARSEFRVRARRLDVGTPSGAGPPGLERVFRDPQGVFLLEGLAAGDWEVRAISPEGLESEAEWLALPGRAALRLVVPRSATIAGRVLGPDGLPVGGAVVRAAAPAPGSPPHGRFPETRADDDGAFRLTGLAPGLVALLAGTPDLAPGPALVLDVFAGQELDQVVLRVQRGGALAGQVLDASGHPEPAARVSTSVPGSDGETDAQGRFLLRGLRPGPERLSARTPAGLELTREVLIEAGRTQTVVLRVPSGRPVRLHGQLSAAGLALVLAGGLVRARAAAPEDGPALAVRGAIEDGAYELWLPGPGRYDLGLELEAGAGRISWQCPVEVPAVDDHELDLAVPLGRLTGRVVDALGQPLAGVPVETTPERHGGVHGATRARSTGQGRYELVVAPGLHTVSAGARLGQAAPAAEDSRHTQARLEGVAVRAGQEVELPDLVLRRAGALEGRVSLADGSPALAARLWSVEPDRVRLLGQAREGAFRVEGLDPGTLRLTACGMGQAARAARALEILAGETARVELVLEPATRVHVRALDPGGALVGCDLTAVDAGGVPVALQRGTLGEAWLGPLPAGRYLVRARRDQRQVERAFELSGTAPEVELSLAFE